LAKDFRGSMAFMNNSEEGLADNKAAAEASAIFLNSSSRCLAETQSNGVDNRCKRRGLISRSTLSLTLWTLSKECLKLLHLTEQTPVEHAKAQGLNLAHQHRPVVVAEAKASRQLGKVHL
jgi:hypothetical protein